jgi:hypothetical protein
VPRTGSGRSILLRLATLGPGLLAFGLAAGCSDDTPRAGSADLAASKSKAAGAGGGHGLDLGPRGADVAPVRTHGKGTAGLPTGSAVKAHGVTR